MALGLKLYLATTRRNGVRKLSEPTHSEIVRLARPAGRLIWLHASSSDEISPIMRLIRELAEQLDQISFLVSSPADIAKKLQLQNLCDQPCIGLSIPAETLNEVSGFLDHWAPDMAVWSGSILRPALLVGTKSRNIPLIMVNACNAAKIDIKMRWKNSVIDSVLKLFSKIYACDKSNESLLIRQGADKENILISGALDQNQPASCTTDSERDKMAEIIGPRPIWFAAEINNDEIKTVMAAHKEASKKSHRLLLIISLKHMDQQNNLAKYLHDDGWVVAQRSLDQEIDENVQVFIADTKEETELWLRLSSVCFLGNSLDNGATGSAPYQAAALGSAILRGPFVSGYQAYYNRLESAGATHIIKNAPDLALGVQQLLAPDKAAEMAHAGWEVSSSGAEATQKVLELIISILDNLEQA